MPPNSKSITASGVTLMRLQEEQNNSSTTDLNNNLLKTDHLLNQVHQFKRNSTDNGLTRTKLDSFELKELNNNVHSVNNSNLSSPLSPNVTTTNHQLNSQLNHSHHSVNHRQPSPTQLNSHSKCNGVCVISNEPKSCLKKNNQHRHLTISHSNGTVQQQKIQIQLNGNVFSPSSIVNSNVLSQHSPLVPSYLSNSSKYTGYSTYGKLTHGTEHLQNTSSLCIDNLHSKTKIYNFKVVIVGDMAAGKTSYIRKLTQPKNGRGSRNNYYMATKGVEAKCKLFEWDDNTLINLEFWEIGGQENYVQMVDMFCRDAFGAILMFDASNKQSLDSLLKWKQSLDSAVRLIDNKPIPTVLVANKCDLETASWLLPDTLDLFCKRNNILTFFYASVRRNVNLENICYDLIAEMLIRYQRKEYKNVLSKPYCQKKSFKKFQNLKCSNCTIL